MNLDLLIAYLQESIKGEIRLFEPMKRHTSWKIGGPADIMVFPRDVKDIEKTIQCCQPFQVPWMVLGSGSNLLVLDGGIRGVVIKTAGSLTASVWTREGVEAESGILLPRLAKEAAQKGFSGIEWCVGIPASLGGAIVMNAGVGEKAFDNYVQGIEVIDEAGNKSFIKRQDLSFDYRHSCLQDKMMVVTKVILTLESDDPKKCEERTRSYILQRRMSQPLEYPTAGSVFKNPPEEYAGRLIEAAGCKGLKSGMAEVSEKHGNFIINRGDALAEDVISLIEDIKIRVHKKFNIDLETEVHIVGEAR